MILICRGANFSANKIGQVTVKEASSLTINGPSSITGLTSQLTATATFTDGSSETVSPLWSITSGNSYATISGSGLLTILPGASSSQVTVMADYDGITKTKVISVTYNFSFTLDVDVSDFVNYNGVAKSIQNDGTLSNNTNTYSCIIPCQSGKSLTITYNSITVGGETYTPAFKIFGFNENRYSSSGDDTRSRILGQAYESTKSTIFEGFYSGAPKQIPDMPLTLPYQYDVNYTAKNVNVPYIGITVQYEKSGRVVLPNLASHASEINMTYSIS